MRESGVRPVRLVVVVAVSLLLAVSFMQYTGQAVIPAGGFPYDDSPGGFVLMADNVQAQNPSVSTVTVQTSSGNTTVAEMRLQNVAITKNDAESPADEDKRLWGSYAGNSTVVFYNFETDDGQNYHYLLNVEGNMNVEPTSGDDLILRTSELSVNHVWSDADIPLIGGLVQITDHEVWNVHPETDDLLADCSGLANNLRVNNQLAYAQYQRTPGEMTMTDVTITVKPGRASVNVPPADDGEWDEGKPGLARLLGCPNNPDPSNP
ncbi:MAG: hypothetical protein SXQ77_13285 [Halobacteria archaeon]|nr:hypothetical protein [Halobacteria archaeon]